MNTTERQKDILKAAFNLIATQGIQELTIKNLAKAVGVSEPALYRHFESKASILAAVVDEIVAIRNEAWRDTVMEGKPAVECLKSFFLRQAQTFEALPSLVIILFPDMLFKQDPVLLGRIRSMVKETGDRIKKLLEAGVAEGSFKKDLDSKAVSLMLIGGFRILVSEWQMNEEQHKNLSLVKSTQQYVRSILLLISAK